MYEREIECIHLSMYPWLLSMQLRFREKNPATQLFWGLSDGSLIPLFIVSELASELPSRLLIVL